MFSDGLLIPAMILAFLAWIVPKLLSLVLPEGVRPLLLNALLSTLLLFVISTLFFVVLYAVQGVGVAEMSEYGFSANAVFFGRLGLISGLVWAPVMVLSVANLPRHWVTKVW